MLITPRLTLSEFTLLDDAFIVTILNSPGWAEFIGPTKVKSLELAQNYIQKTLQNSYKENGYGLWKVTLTASNTPIGMCGLVKRSYLPNPDLGFAFLPEYMGQGYALEICRACLQFAENKFGFPRISAITVEQNTRSIQLLEKLEFEFEKTLTPPDSNEELLLYTWES